MRCSVLSPLLMVLFFFPVLTHAQEVDALTGASTYYATEALSKETILDLIQNRFNDRVVVVGTTNEDGSPNAGIFTLTTVADKLMIYGGESQQTFRNLKRRKAGLVIVYQLPQKGEIWTMHRGARIAVRLIEDPQTIKKLEAQKGVGVEAGSWSFLEITTVKPLG